MKIIKHRINSKKQLNINDVDGVELDLRYKEKDIILHHDPFIDGEKFEDYFQRI